MAKKKSFVFNLEWADVLSEYPAEVRYEVYDAIIGYAQSGTFSELKPLAKMAFSFIKKEMDYNSKRYEEISEVRRDAGRRGGAPYGNSNASKEQPEQPKTTKNNQNNQNGINDNDNDNDNESDLTRTREKNRFAPLNANDVAFADFYKNTFGTEFLWNETTSDDVQRLVDCITDKIIEGGGEPKPLEMPSNITAFLTAVYRLGDNWINQRFNPQLIAKQFNQLYNQITNGSKQTRNYRKSRNDNPTGVSDEFLAKIASDLGGGSL